jgi:hypothetical protein
VGNIKVEIDYSEASAVIQAARASARNLLDWCDRIDKQLDKAVTENERDKSSVDSVCEAD